MIKPFSYKDARQRQPEAWAMVDGLHKDVAPRGLGRFEQSAGRWYYVEPNGLAIPVSKPLPLPQPEANRQVATCRCGPHTCSACGTPHWIEIHGWADGVCTYCYHRG